MHPFVYKLRSEVYFMLKSLMRSSCMLGTNIFNTQKIMLGTNRQLFLMHSTEHKFRAADKKRVPNVLMPKFNVAEVRIPPVHYERLLCKS